MSDKVKHVPKKDSDPLRVLVLPVGRDGCSYYRITQPYKRLAKEEGVEVIMQQNGTLASQEFVQNVAAADVIVAREMHKELLNEFIYKNFETENKKIVFDFDDDLFDISPYADIYAYHGTQEVKHRNEDGTEFMLWEDGKNGFDVARNTERIESTLELVRKVDIVTVTTERLAKRFSEYNQNVVVVPNALDLSVWHEYPLKKKEFRIGWTGGSTHYADWAEVKSVIEKFLKENKDTKLIMAGVNWDGIVKNIDKSQFEFWDWVDAEGHGYRTALMNLDIAIIPLADNSFNSYKSCIKWYEFASLGVPCIVSNVPPYSDEVEHGKTAYTYDTQSQLAEMLTMLKENKAERKKIAKNASNWVKNNRNIDDVVDNLYEVLKK